jgi:hypothetical protein
MYFQAGEPMATSLIINVEQFLEPLAGKVTFMNYRR